MYNEDFTPKKVKEILSNLRIPILPILNKQHKPINYYTIFDFNRSVKNKKDRINPILIMAGGRVKDCILSPQFCRNLLYQ